MLQYIVGALQKLAATRDAAVVVLTQCATRMQAEKGATLIPSINANVWEQGIATRVALFRDWTWNAGRASGTRLAAVQKLNGMVASDSTEKVFAFKIESVRCHHYSFRAWSYIDQALDGSGVSRLRRRPTGNRIRSQAQTRPSAL